MNYKEDFLYDLFKRGDIPKSQQKLYQYIKKNYPNEKFTLKQIKEFFDKQETNQIFKPVKRDLNRFNEIKVYKVGNLQMDIMDMNYYKKYNKNYRYILVVIDVYSRKCFLRAILDKSSEPVFKRYEDN